MVSHLDRGLELLEVLGEARRPFLLCRQLAAPQAYTRKAVIVSWSVSGYVLRERQRDWVQCTYGGVRRHGLVFARGLR
jgi:hypothetical protein